MKTLALQQQKRSTPWNLLIDTFEGCATVLDAVIAGKKYAQEAINMIQVQDGRWKNRWGRALYGNAITGEADILGASTFTKSDGTREIIAIGSTTGKAYKSTDGGTWTEITGATFDITTKNYFFKQINSYLFICNGVDRLTRYNGTVLSRYTAISAPSSLAGVKTVLTAGSYHNYYVVTAVNDIGETIASNEIDVPTSKLRDSWLTATEWIDLTWTAVAGATYYQIYYADLSGKEELLANSATNAYKDNNTATVNVYKTFPLADSTGAPKFSIITTSTAGSIGSRIWGIAPNEFPNRVFFSGTGQYIGMFSDVFGGGWIDLDQGGDEKVAYIEHFRTGKGDTAATVFMSSPNGKGSVWQVTIVQVPVGDGTVFVPSSDKIVGGLGTNTPGGAILVGDSIMFLGASGALELSNKVNVQNVLSTTPKSQNIRPSYLSLNFSKSQQFRAYTYQNFVFYSATEGTGENDIIFIYDKDLDRWYWKWTFGVRQFLEYTENSSGKTKFLMVPTSGNNLVECSEFISGDFGAPISTSLLTGLIPVDDNDRYAFAKVSESLIELGRPKGTIYHEILGIGKKKGFASLATKQITDSLQSGEFWTGSLGEITLMDEEDAPVSYSSASVKKRKRIGKSLSHIQHHVYSNTGDTEYTVLAIQDTGVMDPSRPPSSWN